MATEEARDLRKQMQQRLSEMKREAASFVSHWQELSEFLAPRTGKYLGKQGNKGAKAHNSIINSAASTALRTLKSGMHAGMTSQSRPWFRLILDDADLMKYAPVKAWLFDLETRMRTVFARSNFYNVMPSMYGSLGGHGTAAMAILEDAESTLRCYLFPIGSFYLSLDERLRVDTLYRNVPMTVRQMVAKFGRDKCSQTVRTLFDRGTYETIIPVVHSIEPNIERDERRLDARDKPWRSIYWEEQGKAEDELLQFSGFDEFPVMAPRWDVEGDDIYGYSPGMEALGTVKGLQFTEKRKAEALDKLVRPPMLGDSSLKELGSSIIAGGITYLDNLGAQKHAGLRPAFQVEPRIDQLRADIEAQKAEIRKIMFEDLMLMFAISDASNVTAREVEERHQEKLLVLGPTVERCGEELYDPVISRTVALLFRNGMIPPPPQEIMDKDLRVEYISIMAQAQKLVGTASLERVAGFVGNLANYNPEARDKLNIDATIDAYADMHGVSPAIIRSGDEVAVIREQRAKEAQMQAMADRAPSMLNVAQAAETLSNTDLSQTSALSRMLGMG